MPEKPLPARVFATFTDDWLITRGVRVRVTAGDVVTVELFPVDEAEPRGSVPTLTLDRAEARKLAELLATGGD